MKSKRQEKILELIAQYAIETQEELLERLSECGIPSTQATVSRDIKQLHLLYLSIRYYTLNDVWNNVTAGMLDRNNGEAARMAMSRWRRAAVLAR